MAYKDPLDERNRAARRKHYAANKEQYLARNEARKTEMREWLIQIKSVPCMDCGIQYNYWVMEFDHRDRNDKIANIGNLVNRGSWKQLREEVAKCDIVCANCHRERTAVQLGWRTAMPVSVG